MSRGKPKKRYHDKNASLISNDTFGTIFDSMLQSEAGKNLTAGELKMYVLCRAQAQSRDGKACLVAHGKEYGRQYNIEIHFVFPAKHMEKYGIDRSNGHKLLQRLEDKGFIEKIESNKHIQKVSVYAFSNKWQNTS